MEKSIRIAGEYTCEDWKKLDLSDDASKDWDTAVDIFKTRMDGRFLNIIDGIKGKNYSGFVILALDCLLIETLQQFKKGEKQTPYRKSEKYFVEFLTETDFKEHFYNEDMAKKFYDQIRCGILHQAEIKENSIILKREGIPLVQYTDDKKGLIINRNIFHKKLVKEFESYLSKLKNPKEKVLRENFIKKMNYICCMDSQ